MPKCSLTRLPLPKPPLMPELQLKLRSREPVPKLPLPKKPQMPPLSSSDKRLRLNTRLNWRPEERRTKNKPRSTREKCLQERRPLRLDSSMSGDQVPLVFLLFLPLLKKSILLMMLPSQYLPTLSQPKLTR